VHPTLSGPATLRIVTDHLRTRATHEYLCTATVTITVAPRPRH
jgi:hypothetical protein